MKWFLAVVFTILFLLWAGVRIVNNIQFDRNISGYLKRAADANTVELAKENLSISVEYLERKKYTAGYTSIVYQTPDEDVGFWFTNLKSSLEELEAVETEATQLEKTNVLMKLRETLLDSEEGSSNITAPAGMSIYPYNMVYAFWGILSGVLAIVFVLALANEY